MNRAASPRKPAAEDTRFTPADFAPKRAADIRKLKFDRAAYEVVRTPDTAPQVIAKTIALLRSVGKHPIDVKKDVPGFVANRLQHALWREAFAIVDRGIADAATVDESIRYGFGLRLPVLGPIETAEMSGLDLVLSIHDYIFPYLDASTEPSTVLRQKVEQGELGFKSGRGFRDWSPEEAQASRRRLMEHLVRLTKDLDTEES